MKQLRILTGAHAGVHLDFTSTRYLIGADDAADIQILDWTSPGLVIEVDSNDMAHIGMSSSGQAKATERLGDFVPRRYGNVVLCIGPSGTEWPSDFDLIARLSRSPSAVVSRASAGASRHLRMLWAGLGSLATAACVGALLAYLTAGARAERLSIPAEPLMVRVKRVVDRVGPAGLHVARNADGVVVRGLLDTAEQAAALREQLDALGSRHVMHAYAAAPTLASQIAEALAQPGLEVRHIGAATFRVTGRVPDPQRVQQAAERVAADLGALVTGIEVAVEAHGANDTRPLSATMNSDGLQYVQTRDGIKHLLMTTPTEPGAAESPDTPTRREPAVQQTQEPQR